MPTLGRHLLLDARRSGPLPTADQLRTVLTDLPLRLGLTTVGSAQVRAEADACLGVILLSESHLAIHVAGDRFHADLFSCAPFDAEGAEDWLVARFGLSECVRRIVSR